MLDNGLRLVFERRPASRGRRARAVRRRRDLPRGEAGPRLPDRPAARGGDDDPRRADELAEAIEDVGGSLEVGATGGSVRVRAEDLALALELLADVTLRPAFPAEAIGSWVARRMAAELRGDLDDPAFRAELSFRGLVYGAHPLGRDPRGGVRDLARLTRQDVRRPPPPSFRARGHDPGRGRRFRSPPPGPPGRSARSATGRAQASPSPSVPARARVRDARASAASITRATRSTSCWATSGSPATIPISTPCVVLDHIFGSGPGFSDRLGRIVRDELGLVYAIGGGMTDSADVLPGLFRVYAGTMPERGRAGRRHDHRPDPRHALRRVLRRRGRACPPLPRRRLGLRLPERRAAGRAAAGPGAAGAAPRRARAPGPTGSRRSRRAQVRKAARTHLRPNALCRVELGPRPPPPRGPKPNAPDVSRSIAWRGHESWHRVFPPIHLRGLTAVRRGLLG